MSDHRTLIFGLQNSHRMVMDNLVNYSELEILFLTYVIPSFDIKSRC